MRHRLLAIAMILASLLQGPALTYAVTLGSSSIGDAITHACGGQVLADGSDCDTCCAHGSMPSCAAQCPVPAGAAMPLVLLTSVRMALRGVVIPDAGVSPFADHDPPHPLRPPIV